MFVSVVLALARPRNIPRITLADPGETSIRGKIAPENPNCTLTSVPVTMKVHSSVRGCPSKTLNALGGCDVMVTSCDSVGEEKAIVMVTVVNKFSDLFIANS